MVRNGLKYETPQIIIIQMDLEQTFLTGSGEGSNEGFFEDPNDYSDFFE